MGEGYSKMILDGRRFGA